MIAYLKINVYLKPMCEVWLYRALRMRDEGNKSERVSWDQKKELTRWGLEIQSLRDLFFFFFFFCHFKSLLDEKEDICVWFDSVVHFV